VYFQNRVSLAEVGARGQAGFLCDMFVSPDHPVVLVTHDVDSVYFEAIDIGFTLDLGVRENCATKHQQSSQNKCAFHHSTSLPISIHPCSQRHDASFLF
jgi:hypothetical protein